MISVIIPVLNEAENIERCLISLKKQRGNKEIIVVDGGSKDKTISIAKKFKVKVLESTPGRPFQMNYGAKKAKGDILLFLHADTLLPKDALMKIENYLKNSNYIGGGFYQRYSKNSLLLSLISFRSNLRTSLTKVFFGDQAIFVRKKEFEKLNGFDPVPIMEDLEFSKKMRRYGRVLVIKDKVITSPRLFARHGLWNYLSMGFLMLIYHLGFSKKKIRRIYDKLIISNKIKYSKLRSKTSLVMFAKYPEPGKVKTRLSRDIGKEKACEVYKSFLSSLIKQHKNNDYDFYIAFTPANKASYFKKLVGNNIFPQKGSDLGFRMLNTFKKLNEYQKIIIIGSDMPDLSKRIVKKAEYELNFNDIVLGPSYDGGYYLVAMKKPHDIFSKMKWSHKNVLKNTLARINKQKLSYKLLNKKHDIDTVQDLKRLNKIFIKR